MVIETFYRTAKGKWSLGNFPELDSDRTLLLLFGPSTLIDSASAIQELVRAYPKSHCLGCSTAGEIMDTTIHDDALVVAVIKFEHTLIRDTFATINRHTASFKAGQRIARDLFDPSLRGVMVLSKGHDVNGSELVNGLNSELPASVVVTGGLAGDGERFQKTWVLVDGVPRVNAVSAIGLYGDRIRIGHGSQGGWDRFGPSRRVTKSDRNVLYELDGEPALDLYERYLGEKSKELPASGLLFPLAVRTDTSSKQEVVRTVLNIDRRNKTMTFAGDIPQGWIVQLMRANFERLIDGAYNAAHSVTNFREFGSPTVSIVISCVGRRMVLKERTDEELDATIEVLPKNTRQIGFYSYGEISPYATGRCDLHNQTMTLTVIGEN